MNKFTIGQTLWFVPYLNHTSRLLTITQVGRKWLQTETHGMRPMRVDAGTLRPHKDDARGQVYLSKEMYEAEIALNKKWQEFREATQGYGWQAPNGMTLEKIEQAMALLGLEAKA